MWAVLPLKDFVSAKQRLSGVLSPSERRGLFQAMVEDVLEQLAGHPNLSGVLLVSDDPTAALLARHYGVEYLAESALGVSGLNPVVQAAAEHLAARGIDGMLVVHGDLPLLDASEIEALIALHRRQRTPAVTVAPDRRGSGTNCLLVSPAQAIRFCYGRDSFYRHREQAVAAGARFHHLSLPGAACDIDNPDDLQQLRQRCGDGRARHSCAYLRRHGIDRRLAMMAAGEANSGPAPGCAGSGEPGGASDAVVAGAGTPATNGKP